MALRTNERTNERQLAFACQIREGNLTNLELSVADARKLPFEDEAFDKVPAEGGCEKRSRRDRSGSE